jgi:hypothetical protein
MFEQTFKNIDDVLWKEAGCATELDYTEQTSWILFLKYLDDLERANEQRAELQSKKALGNLAHVGAGNPAPQDKALFRNGTQGARQIRHRRCRAPYFGDYPKDFFDLIVIDECHRGGANDESNWRDILDYFAPAVQLGLTATPKRRDNVDTYAYFGEPVYTYSLKQGINDGFLTPFKVVQIATTLDDYVYTPDDKIIEGEIEEGTRYGEPQFNRTIEIEERERYRVKLFMGLIDQRQKTLVFCATQDHALWYAT